MKRHNFDFFKRNFKSPLVMLVSMVLLCVIMAGCFTACKNTGNTDGTSAMQIDENTYVFSAPIMLGSVNLSGRVYKDAKDLAEKECLAMISDFVLKVKAEEKDFAFEKDSFLWDTNVEESLKQAVEYNEKNGDSKNDAPRFDLTFTVNENSVKEAAAGVASEVDILPVDANIDTSGATLEFTQEKDGYQVDQEKLASDMMKEIPDLSTGKKAEASVVAEMKVTKPAVTQEQIDGNITLLASFTTHSTSSANSEHNMKVAAEACTGSVIQPGEIWSFNGCTGDSNLTSLGYVESTVIMNGDYAQGVGGGICQTSTTIYNAALLANLEIVERYCHLFQSSYAEAGLDATIDYPNLDLKLKNITEYPIYLECYMEGSEVTCNFYGWKDPSFDEIKITSYIYDANPDKNYYRAGAYRIYYKDGQEIRRESLHSSEYAYTSTKPTETTVPTETTEATEATNTVPVTQAPTTVPDPTEPTTGAVITPDPTEAPIETPVASEAP